MASISFCGQNHGLQIGDNRGPINAEFRLLAERPETPPRPSWAVPFPRDLDFVSRDSLLDRIREKSAVAGSRIALVGLGGVGKSQAVIEYSYQVRSKSPSTWVFWVHSSNKARFVQSFHGIADQCKIRGRWDPQVNIFKLDESQLRDEKIGKWICILDNVDDDEFLCFAPTTNPAKGTMEASDKPLLDYIPRSSNGCIIITSRSRQVALKMVDHKDLVEVKPMETSEALELLERKLEQPGQCQEGRELVSSLELMPLAIVQAASYIRNRAPRYSVSKYLKDLQSDHEATRLLKKEPGYVYRDWEASSSILLTWQISFDHIRRSKKSAADLLSLMSFFDRQGIPEDILPRFCGIQRPWLSRLRRNLQAALYGGHRSLQMMHPEKVHKETRNMFETHSRSLHSEDNGESCTHGTLDENFEDDVEILRSYSFISVSQDPRFFGMHRLVQLATWKWLEVNGMIEPWKQQYIKCLFDRFPRGDYENWATCRSLFPHVKSALLQQPRDENAILQWAGLLYKGAWYASQSGNFPDAREMAWRSMKERERILGPRNKDTLESSSMLARAHWLEGSWEEAEKLYTKVFQYRKEMLGKDHLSLLTSMANLASTYWNLGRWKEAENLFKQVMQTRETELGKDHPLTLTSMSNLAVIFACQGRLEEAEKLEVRVLESRKAILGDSHPSTLTSMSNLALTYGDQRRWEEAESIFLQVIQASKKRLGEDHPVTLTSMANLGLVFGAQGRQEEAEKLGIHVMETRKTKLGDGHPSTLTSMANLVSLNRDRRRLAPSEKLFEV